MTVITTVPVPVPANDVGDAGAPGTLIEFLARAVRDPSIDVHKLEAIYRMQREIINDDRRAQFHEAMNLVQAEMQPVVRDARNAEKGNKYATLEAVDAAIRPIYAKHGFALGFTETPNDQPELKITCIVTRRGHAEPYFLSALSDTVGPQGKPNKTSIQGTASSVTYLRRYLTCMIFNIALRDDNDGNSMREGIETGEVTGQNGVDILFALIADCARDPRATAANERAFLDAFGFPALTSIKQIPAREFPRLKNALIQKRAVLEARRAANTQAQNRSAA